MSIASYLSDLIEASGEVEELGIYAPKALREAKLLYQLLSYNMVLVPLDYLAESCSKVGEEALNLIRKIAKTLIALKINPNMFMSFLLRNLPYVIDNGDKFIIAKHEKNLIIVNMVKEYAKSLGLKINDSDEVLIIHKVPA